MLVKLGFGGMKVIGLMKNDLQLHSFTKYDFFIGLVCL